MKETKSTFGWIFTFAGQKKSGYIGSVCLAMAGAVFQMFPFLVMARILEKLMDGNREFTGYMMDCAVMAVFWMFRVLFHSLSTMLSHKVTFTVLTNIRKQGLSKLSRMPLGAVQAKGSGELKNILVERVDSIEPTLAHVLPEMSSNAMVVLATLCYLFVLDWRMALASLITLPLGMIFFMRVDARLLPDIFEKGEVDKIYLNFSDPWPKARHAKRRLTSREFLARYDQILVQDGKVEFKTDNRDLFEFSLEEVKEAGWNLENYTFDLHHNEEMVQGNVMTEYEEKFSSMGNPICKMVISRG